MGKAREEFPGQLPGEEVLYMFRKHPVVMRKGLIIAAAGLLVGPLTTTFLTTDFGMKVARLDTLPSMGFFFGALGFSLVLSAILFFPGFMSWYFSVYIVTSQRFIQVVQKGFFTRGVSDTPLKQIQSLNYYVKGIEQSLLGFGTIEIQTYIGDIVIHEIHHPEKTCAHISDILSEKGIHPADYPAESKIEES